MLIADLTKCTLLYKNKIVKLSNKIKIFTITFHQNQVKTNKSEKIIKSLVTVTEKISAKMLKFRLP